MLKKRLAESRPFLGLLQMCPNPVLGELAGECGYDFLILDAEHGVLSDRDFAEGLNALAETDVFAFVRLAKHDVQALRQYLEMGADAIVVPNVSTPQQANTLARAMSSHKEACLIVLIESALGVANAADILAVEGVSGAFIGPNDLSSDLGHHGNYAHPAYVEALARIEQAAAVTGKALGTAAHGDYSLTVLHSRGHRLFVLGGDRSLLREAMQTHMTKARACL